MEHVIIRPYEERDREALCRIHDGARPMELAWLYVDPARMGRGIGRQLAAHAMARAKGRPLAVEVLAGNTPALALYQSLGFKTVETAFGPMPGNEAFAVTVHCMELR